MEELKGIDSLSLGDGVGNCSRGVYKVGENGMFAVRMSSVNYLHSLTLAEAHKNNLTWWGGYHILGTIL